MQLSEIIKQIEEISKTYAKDYNINRTPDWLMLKLQEEIGELTQAYLMNSGQARTKNKTEEELSESFAHELADSLCQILLIAHHNNIDIEKAIEEKWLRWSK